MGEETVVQTENTSGSQTTESSNDVAPVQTTETVQKPAETQQGSEQKTETNGTSAETVKPEFSDPNMQKRFTERMQEFSKKEAEYNAKLTKAKAFERLEQDKEVVDFLQRKYGLKQPEKAPIPELTEEQFLEATTNPVKFKETIVNFSKNIVESMLQERLQPFAQDVAAMKSEHATKALEQDIDDFANSKDDKGNALYPDFWNYSGDIQQYLEKFKVVPLSNAEKLDTAYRLAKYPHLQKETISKAHNLIASKKAASADKGGSSNAQKFDKNKSLNDVIEETANSLKWN